MSEQTSPLLSAQGRTTIADAVVSRIAGLAAQEVEGVRMGNEGTRLPGDSSPTVGEFFGSLTPGANTQRQTRGVSVDVGEVESAIDLSMAVEYGRSIQQVTEAVRNNVINRVENLAGLRVTEVNITVNDVFFPEHD
jgi:uncharacterized alkaline shock family protein YloU